MIKLKELRNKIGISQKEVAQKVGINYSMYNRYENGLNEPDLATVIKLADFFGVSVDTLLGHECEMLDKRKLSKEQNEIVDLALKFNLKQQYDALGYMRRINEENKK